MMCYYIVVHCVISNRLFYCIIAFLHCFHRRICRTHEISCIFTTHP